MVGHNAHMFKRSFGDGKLEQQVDLWHEGVEIIDERDTERAQTHDFA